MLIKVRTGVSLAEVELAGRLWDVLRTFSFSFSFSFSSLFLLFDFISASSFISFFWINHVINWEYEIDDNLVIIKLQSLAAVESSFFGRISILNNIFIFHSSCYSWLLLNLLPVFNRFFFLLVLSLWVAWIFCGADRKSFAIGASSVGGWISKSSSTLSEGRNRSWHRVPVPNSLLGWVIIIAYWPFI